MRFFLISRSSIFLLLRRYFPFLWDLRISSQAGRGSSRLNGSSGPVSSSSLSSQLPTLWLLFSTLASSAPSGFYPQLCVKATLVASAVTLFLNPVTQSCVRHSARTDDFPPWRHFFNVRCFLLWLFCLFWTLLPLSVGTLQGRVLGPFLSVLALRSLGVGFPCVDGASICTAGPTSLSLNIGLTHPNPLLDHHLEV